MVTAGRPWCRQVGLSRTGQNCEVRFASDKPLDGAVLVSTTDGGVTGSRAWRESPATLDQADTCWIVTARLPAKTTAWFINCSSGDLVTSSDYQEVDEPASNAGPPSVTRNDRGRVLAGMNADGDGSLTPNGFGTVFERHDSASNLDLFPARSGNLAEDRAGQARDCDAPQQMPSLAKRRAEDLSLRRPSALRN